MNTSIRRTGSVIALCSVSILTLTVKIKPQNHRTKIKAKGGVATALTAKKLSHLQFGERCNLPKLTCH